MTEDVLISISGLQFEGPMDDKQGSVELLVGGKYRFEDGLHILEYEEEMEGMPGPIRNVITAGAERVELSKTGGMAVSMVFEEGHKNLSNYRTPFGNLVVAIDTTDIKIEESEDAMNITVLYHLDLNYEYFADCRVKIGVRSKS